MRAYRVVLVVGVLLATLACSPLSLLNQEPAEAPTEAPARDMPVEKATESTPEKPADEPEEPEEPEETLAIQSGEPLAQWAVAAFASSEYGEDAWSAAQATGAPDTEVCGDEITAWAASTADSLEEWLEVQYARPVIPSEIHIYETFAPGGVVKVEVITVVSEYLTVWEGPVNPEAPCPRIFRVKVDGVDAPVTGVRITLDQSVMQNWSEIDAVQLVGMLAP
ncbi:MAG: hypothetical protein JXB35_04990 [Anaerolineae bacterium]|nr:hypothetical protein [Anaerolineae bacterium]